MDPESREIRRRLAEQQRQRELDAALVAQLFAQQLAFINDESKRITNDSGRRAGKTHVISSRGLKKGASSKRVLIVSISKPHAVELYWEELTKLCEALKLNVKADNVRHTLSFSNGGMVALGGVSSKDEREKCRGKGWHEVVCDETGSFGVFLTYFIEDVLDATLADYDGTLVLAGTPSPTGVGYYADACKDPSWSHHHWTVAENSMLPQWAGDPCWHERALAFLADKKEKLPLAKYEREYLGLNVRDLSALLVTLDDRNRYDILPVRRWAYVMGIDTGSKDESAIVLLAVSKETNEIFVVDEWAKSGVLIDDPKNIENSLVGQIRRIAGDKHPRMVIDPANKQLVDSMSMLYNLPLEKADKLGKAAHIDILNTGAHQGLVKFPKHSPTFDQSSTLEWDDKRQREREGQPCDRFDALLYAFTFAHQENFWRPEEQPQKTKDHPMIQEARRLEAEERDAKRRHEKEKQAWGNDTLDFGTEPLDF